MQLAGAVDREHAFRHLAEHVPQSRNVECGSAHGAEEIHALDELHRVEPLVTLDDELIETHQVRVGHVGEHAEFLLEARIASGLVLNSVFSATSSRRCRSKAAKTTPMPPAPSLRSSRNRGVP